VSASDGQGPAHWTRRFYVAEDRQEGGRRVLSHPLSQFVGSLREAEAHRKALLPAHPGAHIVAVSTPPPPRAWPAAMLRQVRPTQPRRVRS
jgi:hypothetical protein